MTDIATILFPQVSSAPEIPLTFTRETPRRTVVAAGKSSVLGEVVDVII